MKRQTTLSSWCMAKPTKIVREECSCSRDINTDSEDNVSSNKSLNVETESEEPHSENMTQESQTLYAEISQSKADSALSECSTCTILCC